MNIRLALNSLDLNSIDWSDLQYLFGMWSCLALGGGIAGMWICRRKVRVGELKQTVKLSGQLAMAMLVFHIFVWTVVLGGSYAYSGPMLESVRELWRYDIYFALRITIVFTSAFIFEWLWIGWMARQKLPPLPHAPQPRA